MNNYSKFGDTRSRYYRVLKAIAESLSISKADQISIEQALQERTRVRLKTRNHWIISGISGSGKSTISQLFINNGFKKLRNVTTRSKRPDETEEDYIFVNDAEFQRLRHNKKIFHPHITNKKWHGILYADLNGLNTDERLFLDKSVKSSIAITSELLNVVETSNFVYLLAPSFEDLVKRVLVREQTNQNNSMSVSDIIDRFNEEIEDMNNTLKLPYAYLINDNEFEINNLISSYID